VRTPADATPQDNLYCLLVSPYRYYGPIGNAQNSYEADAVRKTYITSSLS
jgi:hypothetical protein